VGVLESTAIVLLVILPGAGIASSGVAPLPGLKTSVVVSERVYVATMVGDVATTYYGLETRQMTERNPILRPLQNRPAAVAALQAGMVAGYVWIARKVGRKHPRAATALHVALAITNVANTINNLWVVNDYRNRLARRARGVL
jgi:hypothetical protein